MPKIFFNYQIWKQVSFLIFKNFFREFRSIFFTFIMPILNLLIFAFIFDKFLDHGSHSVVGGYLLLTPITVGFNSLAFNVIDWKKSILLRRLSITNFRKHHFLFILLLTYFILSMFSTFWTLIWTFILQLETWDNLVKINGGLFLIGWIITTVTSINLAIFFSGISNSQSNLQAFIFFIYFPSVFLTGISFPINEMNHPKLDLINNIGYFIPHKYGASIANFAWNNGITHTKLIKYGFSDILTPIFAGIFINISLLILSSLTFKWETKK